MQRQRSLDLYFKPKSSTSTTSSNSQENETPEGAVEPSPATLSEPEPTEVASADLSDSATIASTSSSSLSHVSYSPCYPDIATCISEGTIIDVSVKKRLIEGTWPDLHRFGFPTRVISGQKRKLPSQWLLDHPWLRYSISTDSLYCVCCVLFGKQDGKEKLFVKPISDWKNLSTLVSRHLKTGSQHSGCAIAAEDFFRIEEKSKESITELMSKGHKDQIMKNRHILKNIIETLILCGKQNIPIRGHTEERSNFFAILQEKAKEDTILSEHLACSQDSRAKYTSPDIQNEILSLCGNQIRDSISGLCMQSLFFAIIADEATDKSTKEQLSLCLRFVDFSCNPFEIREQFVGFMYAKSIKGQAIAQMIIEKLNEINLDITKLRAQCYDGASNMSGKFNGVQAIIKREAPLANYVHCKAHSLNLALVHSSKESCVRTVMATVQEVAFAFEYSAKRLVAFEDELSTDYDTQGKMERRSKLRTLCETRWSSRADSLFTFKTAFPVIVHALENLKDDGDEKAGMHLAAILRFEFIIGLVVSEFLLRGTVGLTNYLQSTDCDLVEAIVESKVTISSLQAERNDPLVWDALYESAVKMASDFEIAPSAPRRTGRQIHRANYAINDPKEYWRVSLFLVFADHLILQMEERLVKNEGRFNAANLIPSKLAGLDDKIEGIYTAYSADLDVTQDVFTGEAKRWKTRWDMTNDKPSSLIDTLRVTNQYAYPSIFKVLTILITMPASSATAERSFSAMKRIKSYLRASMGDERLSALALMHVHRTFKIDIEELIRVFASQKTRRMAFY